MALNLELTDPQLHPRLTPHRVVPVRFARVVAGFSDDTAPDPDDHGFTIPAQFATAHGPVVGLLGPQAPAAAGPTVKIRVIRERVEAATQLFATVDDTSIVQIEFPVGAALNSANIPATATTPARPADTIFIRGVSTAAAAAETKLKIRFGSATGQVMAEMGVRVYPVLVINVQAHLVTINGTAPTTTGAQITTMFQNIGKIYAQAGVTFLLAGAAMVENVNGFARPGTVTLTNVADQRNRELQTVLRQNPQPNMLNAYFFAHYFDTVSGLQDQVLGIAFSTDDANANPPAGTFPGCQAGITVRDTNDPIEAAHTAAHEIGHALRLQHYGRGNGANIRHDIWAHRALMHNFVDLITAPPPRSVARADVGYGNYADGRISAGELICTKPRAGIPQSDQVNIVRDSVVNGTFMPV